MNIVYPRAATGPRTANEALGSHSVTLIDTFIAFAMVGSICCIGFLNHQANRLRGDVATYSAQATAASSLELTLSRNIFLTSFAGRNLPPVLSVGVIDPDRRTSVARRGYLAMIYTPGACEKSIMDGLKSLERVRAGFAAQGIETRAIAGVSTLIDREHTLIVHSEGQFGFPLAFVSRVAVAASLFPKNDSTFVDEPIYVRLDSSLVVVAAIHGDQRRPELLDRWLAALK